MLGKSGAGEVDQEKQFTSMESFIPNTKTSPRNPSSMAYSPTCLLEVSLDNIAENNLIGKIINQDEADRGATSEGLFLIVQTGNDKCSVSVSKLANMEPVF